MADIGKALKDEITRITKRESKKLMADHIKTIRNLKQEVAALKKQIGKPAVASPEKARPAPTAESEAEAKSVWFTRKGVKGIRKRLGVNRSQMAKLCGVSPNAVGKWESAGTGKLNLRYKTRAALIELRQMSPKAAQQALAEK